MDIQLTPGQTAIVGYGSLLSRASLEKTLKRPYGGFFGPCRVAGWRRAWNIGMPNRAFYFRRDGAAVYPEKILYLNVTPDRASVMNAMLFVVDAAELAAMHAREWIYEPQVVTSRLREVSIEGGDAIMYVARPEYVVAGASGPEEAAVRASYLRIVEDGLTRTEAGFRDEYLRTTDPVPERLVVDDALDPERPSPWASRQQAAGSGQPEGMP